MRPKARNEIDCQVLETLGVPVVPVVATTGDGIKGLIRALDRLKFPN